MKVAELMIGDWVIDQRKNIPVKIDPFLVMGLEIPFKPILLTAEILEKNGWKQSVLHGRSNIVINSYWVLDSNGTHIEIKRDIMAVWLNYDNTNDVIYADYILPNPLAVHTLQHALRLCGLNDMADNFKIN